MLPLALTALYIYKLATSKFSAVNMITTAVATLNMVSCAACELSRLTIITLTNHSKSCFAQITLIFLLYNKTHIKHAMENKGKQLLHAHVKKEK